MSEDLLDPSSATTKLTDSTSLSSQQPRIQSTQASEPQHLIPRKPVNPKKSLGGSSNRNLLESTTSLSEKSTRKYTSKASTPSTKRSKQRSSSSLNFDNWWLAEIAAAIIALAALASLIAVLKAYSHTPAVPDIGYGITLNGLVAALSTIVRTALLVLVGSG